MITLTLHNFEEFVEEIKINELSFEPVIAVGLEYTYINHTHIYDIYATAYNSSKNMILRLNYARVSELFSEKAQNRMKKVAEELTEKLKKEFNNFRIRNGLWHDSNDTLLRRL